MPIKGFTLVFQGPLTPTMGIGHLHRFVERYADIFIVHVWQGPLSSLIGLYSVVYVPVS